MRTTVLRLLLACTLASAQLGGFLHSLSHLDGPSRDESPAGALHPHHCVFCDAYDVFDYCVSGAVATSLPAPYHAALPPAFYREFLPAQTAPFAIRAPPV